MHVFAAQKMMLIWLVAFAPVVVGCVGGGKKAPGTCGNGLLDLNEECDGGRFWGQTCEGYGFQGGFLSCGPLCTVDVSTCNGYLPTCGNGRVEDQEACDTTELSGVTCESWGFDGGRLACTVACTFDTTGCIGTCASTCIRGSHRCVGDQVEVCEMVPGACNAWRTDRDCATDGLACVQVDFRTAECRAVCDDPCAPGERRCTEDGSGLLTCTVSGDGDCFRWEEQACDEGQVCVAGREANCQEPCANPCDPLDEGAQRCSPDGGGLEACMRIDDTCVRWVWQSDCDDEGICLPWLVACEPRGAGDTCEEARWALPEGLVLEGADFLADFTDDATGLSDAPGCAGGTAGPEVFWRTRLSGGDTVVVTVVEGPGLRLRAHQDCQTLTCLADAGRLVFTAPADGEYVFSAEGWGTGTSAYEIRMAPVVWLAVGQPCGGSDTAEVCEASYCAMEPGSPTGYACRAVAGGDTCPEAVAVGSGSGMGALQGLTDAVAFPGFSGTVEQWWSFTPTVDGTHVISVADAGFAANLLVFEACDDVPETALAAASGVGELELRLPLVAGAPVHVAVEKAGPLLSSTLPYGYRLQVSVQAVTEAGLCADGVDNDADCAADCADADCAGIDAACLVEAACANGVDEDADGLLDCADPDCASLPACWAVAALYTQLADGAPAGLEGRRLRFVPRPGALREYDWHLEEPAAFLVTPGVSGIGVDVVDDGLYPFSLPMRFPFFGVTYESVWVSSNGWLSFVAPAGSQPYESAQVLVSLPTVALLWDDLSRIQFGDEFRADWGYDPGDGRVFWAFTYHCREYTSPDNRLLAQVVLFDDGEIRMDWLICGVGDGIVGIASPGLGTAPSPVTFLP